MTVFRWLFDFEHKTGISPVVTMVGLIGCIIVVFVFFARRNR
jgi:hypothetical protein